jgi:hypothetical protein
MRIAIPGAMSSLPRSCMTDSWIYLMSGSRVAAAIEPEAQVRL